MKGENNTKKKSTTLTGRTIQQLRVRVRDNGLNREVTVACGWCLARYKRPQLHNDCFSPTTHDLIRKVKKKKKTKVGETRE